MKKFFAIIFIAAVLTSCQKENVTSNSTATEDRIATPPKTVSDAFAANFGSLKVSEWKLRNDGTWRAHLPRMVKPGKQLLVLPVTY